MALPLESPPMSPSGPGSPGFRMVEKLYIDPDFKPIMKDKNIKKFLEEVIKSNNIQRGRTSDARVIEIDGNKFILRITPYASYLQRTKAVKEIAIYEQLKKDPTFFHFISNLLYADAHLASGKKESYFIFAYEPGMTLDRFIDSHKQSLTRDQVMGIYNHLELAIDFLERNGIVHKDIKPENIFFSTSRKIPLLFDFDTSCFIKEDCDAVEFEGSPKYATPDSKTIRRQEGFSSNFKLYRYSSIYDKYSLAKMLEDDLVEMIANPKEKEEVEAFAKSQQIILLSQNKNKQRKGGMRRNRNKTRKVRGGECRIGVLNPWWGGKSKPENNTEALLDFSESVISGGGCCGNTPKPMMELPPGFSLGPLTAGLKGGGCGCRAVPPIPTPLGGGYRPTKRDLKYLKMWKQGKSIGFTMRSSLKAKGLIPRANGTKRVSNKYKK